MSVSKEVQKLEKSALRVTLTVDREEVRKSYDDLMKEYVKSVQLPGFRKGHVPQTILERKFGESIRQDASSRLMEKAVQEALEGDSSIRPLPYSTPQVDQAPVLNLESDFSFAVTFDVFPEFTLGSTDGIEVEIPKVDVSADDEAREMEALRERNALVIDKEEGKKADKGDVATIDYAELDAEGNEVPGSAREGFVFTIGSGENLYAIDDEVIGMVKGKEKTFDKAFPEDYRYKDIAGSTKKLRVKLAQLKARQLPALDDDFAQDISEKFTSLADLKADIRKKLEDRLEEKLRLKKEEQTIEALISRNPIDLPESMVQMQLESQFRDFMGRIGADEATMLKLLSSSGKNPQALMEEWRPTAEKQIRTRLILEKLVDERKEECSDEELASEYARMAAASGVGPDEVKAQYERMNMVDRLRDHIKEDKVFQAIWASGKVKTGKKAKFLDLFAENE